MSVDDPTTTIEVSVEDDAAATDDDEDDNVLREFGEEPAATDVRDNHKQHDGVSLRIDDGDVVEPLCKPGKHLLAGQSGEQVLVTCNNFRFKSLGMYRLQ